MILIKHQMHSIVITNVNAHTEATLQPPKANYIWRP